MDVFSDIGDVAGSALGFGKNDTERAQQDYIQQLQQLGAAPNLAPLNLQQYQWTPQAATAFNQASADPAAITAQHQALNQLRDLATSGQATPQELQMLQQINQQQNAQMRGANQAVMQNAQARGVGGGGLELAGLLQNASTASQNRNTQDLGVLANAQNRALQALSGMGNLATNVREQSYGEEANKAQAQDIINRFNVGNRNEISGMNTNLQNQQQIYNTQQLPQQNYNNQLSFLQNQNQANLAKAGMADQRHGQAWQSIGLAADPFNISGVFTPGQPGAARQAASSAGQSFGSSFGKGAAGALF